MNGNTDYLDFMSEGGDEVLNRYECPHCGETFDSSEVEMADEANGVCHCPMCGQQISM